MNNANTTRKLWKYIGETYILGVGITIGSTAGRTGTEFCLDYNYYKKHKELKSKLDSKQSPFNKLLLDNNMKIENINIMKEGIKAINYSIISSMPKILAWPLHPDFITLGILFAYFGKYI